MFGIKKMKTFISMQDNSAKIKILLQESTANLVEIKKLVRNDPKLSALVLKVINNPFFGIDENIGDSGRAIDLLGIVQLHEILSEEKIRPAQASTTKSTHLRPKNRVMTEQAFVI